MICRSTYKQFDLTREFRAKEQTFVPEKGRLLDRLAVLRRPSSQNTYGMAVNTHLTSALERVVALECGVHFTDLQNMENRPNSVTSTKIAFLCLNENICFKILSGEQRPFHIFQAIVSSIYFL